MLYTPVTLIFYFVVLFSTSGFLGQLIIGSRFWNRNTTLLSAKVGLCTIIGFAALILIFFAIATITIQTWIFVLVILLINLAGMWKFVGLRLKHRLWHFEKKEYFFIASYLAFIFYIGYVVIDYGWPPAGDISNHGLVTSLAIYNGRLPLNYAPLAPSYGIDLPTGTHSLAAFFSELIGIYPAESMFVLGWFLVCVVFLACYTLSIQLTNSVSLSVISALFLLVINTTGNLESWFLGYFFNGPYPNIAGFFLLLTSIILFIKVRETHDEDKRKIKVLQIMVFVSLLVTYSLFAVIPIVFFLATVFFDSRSSKQRVSKISRQFASNYKLVIGLAIAILVSVLILYPIIGQSPISITLSKILGRSSYTLNYEYFRSDVFGILSVLAFVLACLLWLRNTKVIFSYYYIVLFFLVFLSLFYENLSLILPRRVAVLLAILAWTVVCIAVQFGTNPSMIGKKIAGRFTFLGNARKFLIYVPRVGSLILLCSVVIVPSLIQHASWQIAERYDWFPKSTYFRSDFPLLEWIDKNVKPKDLILNDYSYTSQYLLSLSVKNVTSFYRINNNYTENRAILAQEYWNDPSNICLLQNVITKYNVSYILFTSEWGYRDWKLLGGDNHYKVKPYDRIKVKEFLSNSPLLEPMITSKLGAVFKVKRGTLDC